MNKINIADLLHGQEGRNIKLWSPAFGECEFLEIHDRSGGRPMIKVRTGSGNCRDLTPTGCLGYEYEGTGGECILWPSKEKQTWDGWIPPRELWAVRNRSGKLYLYLGQPWKPGNEEPILTLGPNDIPEVTTENSPYHLK